MTNDRPPLSVVGRRRRSPPEADTILTSSTPVAVVKSLWPVAPVGAVDPADSMPLAEAVRRMAGAGLSDNVARTEIARRIFTGLLPVSAELVTYERPAGTGVLVKLRWPDASAQLGEQMLRANGQGALSIVWETGELRWSDFREAIPYHAIIQGAMVGRAAVLALVDPAAPSPAASGGLVPTGLAGRPSAKDAIAAIMRKRADDGEICKSYAKECEALAKIWADTKAASDPVCTAKTIENSLRELYRKLAPKLPPKLPPKLS